MKRMVFAVAATIGAYLWASFMTWQFPVRFWDWSISDRFDFLVALLGALIVTQFVLWVLEETKE